MIDMRAGDQLTARAGCVGRAPPHESGVATLIPHGTPMVLLGVATVRVMLPGREVREVRIEDVRLA